MTAAQLALDLWPAVPSGPGIYAWEWAGSAYRGRIVGWAQDSDEAPCWLELSILWQDGEAVDAVQVHTGGVRWPELRGTWGRECAS